MAELTRGSVDGTVSKGGTSASTSGGDKTDDGRPVTGGLLVTGAAVSSLLDIRSTAVAICSTSSYVYIPLETRSATVDAAAGMGSVCRVGRGVAASWCCRWAIDTFSTIMQSVWLY
jgi:hypothetical protein